MLFAYTIAIHTFYILMILAGLFNRKAKLWVNGRKNWRNVLAEKPRNEKLFWFHAASLGEFEQGLPVMEALRSAFPHCTIAVSFFSPSGYEVRKNSPYADIVFYLPLDTRKNATDLIRLLKPTAVIFIKYEFWYFVLNELKSRSIPVYLLSGIFRSRQIFFRWYGSWFRKNLEAFRHIFVQNESSVSLLKTIGIDHTTVSGDTRFDRVTRNASARTEFPVIEEFTMNSPCLVAGSTWPEDESWLVEYINNSSHQLRFIIAPHEISQSHLANLVRSIRKSPVLYSDARPESVKDKQVMIIDNIGMLSALYRYGRIAYIGGGFGKGIHNLLEAAVFNIPVIFGPNYHKHREAIELIAIGGGYTVADAGEFEKVMENLTLQDQAYQDAASRAGKYVAENTGATERVMSFILPEIRSV